MSAPKEKEPIVSHGRGGQGNIGADSTQYIDGEIVRSGPVGDQGDGAYSAGRGGIGNIGSPHVRPETPGKSHDSEVVPEAAVRQSLEGDYHVGRGGKGNVHIEPSHKTEKEHHSSAEKQKEKEEGDSKHTPAAAPSSSSAHAHAHVGLADKLKQKVFGKK